MTVNPFNPEGLTAAKVSQYHTKDDLNSSYDAHHHSLGWGPNKAAPGPDVKRALDENSENLELINQLIADLDAAVTELNAVTADLDKVGRRQSMYVATTNTIPNAGSITTFSGFDVFRGNEGHNTNDGWTGIIYNGAGVWECLETGSYTFEVAVNWAASASGRRIYVVSLNEALSFTASYYRFTVTPSTANIYLHFEKFDMDLMAGDLLRVGIYQDSGAALARTIADGLKRDGVNYSMMFSVLRQRGV